MVAVLHNIRSLTNVGSIFRTADGAGVSKLFLCGITGAPIDQWGRARRLVKKVALGAEQYVPWEKATSTLRVMRALKTAGYTLYAVEQAKHAKPYYSVKNQHPSRIALILGSETRGLPRGALNFADAILEIPMAGKKESLNVAVAFGIVAYHFSRPHT